jgi:hypothetical protein
MGLIEDRFVDQLSFQRIFEILFMLVLQVLGARRIGPTERADTASSITMKAPKRDPAGQATSSWALQRRV